MARRWRVERRPWRAVALRKGHRRAERQDRRTQPGRKIFRSDPAGAAPTCETLEKTRGPLDRDVAGALNNLAQLYGDQGRDAEAEPLYKRAHRHPGEDGRVSTPSTIAPELNNLAALYQRQERYAEAEPLFKRALALPREIAAAQIIPMSDNP